MIVKSSNFIILNFYLIFLKEDYFLYFRFLSIYQELEKEKETVSKTELFFKAEEIFNQEYSKTSGGKKKLKKVEEIEKDEFKEE